MTSRCDRVLILGCGYVGTALGEALAVRGCDVIGTTTTQQKVPALEKCGIRPAVVRHEEIDKLRELLRDRQAAVICVAPGGGRSDYRAVYLEGVRNLLRAAEGTALRRIVHISSTSVYGYDDGRWVDETVDPRPASENGSILLETENVLLQAAGKQGIMATVLRCSGIYGPGRDPADWAARSAGAIRDDGEAWLNLIHRDDVVQAIVALLDRPLAEVLNLSDERPTRRREFYDRLIAASRLPAIQWRSPPPGSGLGKRIDTGRIRAKLGIRMMHPTHEAGTD